MTTPSSAPTPVTSTPGPAIAGQEPKADVDSPAFRNKIHRAQADAWQMLDDVYAGTDKLWERMETYFPKGVGEKPEKWRQRVRLSRFYNALEITLHGLVGLMLKKPVTLADDASPRIRELAENIDGQGTHLQVFARELAERGMLHGHAGFLVDAPPAPNLGRRPTKADAKRFNARAYFIPYRADQIINFRVAVRPDGQVYLALLVLEEKETRALGKFGEHEVTQHRVLRATPEGVVTYELWEPTPDGKSAVITKEGTIAHVKDIPFVGYYAGRRLGWFHTKPPLKVLAEQNLDLHTVQIDHRFAMAIANRPTLVRKGGKDVKVALGGDSGIDLPLDAAADVKWLETNGSSLGQSREEMKDILARLASLGLQMLSPETRAAETAQAKQIDKAESDSRLAVSAIGLRDALEQGFVYLGQMIGEEAASVTVTLELGGLTLDSATIASYAGMVRDYQLTLETFWQILQEGGKLPADFNPKREARNLDEQVAVARASEPTPPTDGEGKDAQGKEGQDEDDDDATGGAGDDGEGGAGE